MLQVRSMSLISSSCKPLWDCSFLNACHSKMSKESSWLKGIKLQWERHTELFLLLDRKSSIKKLKPIELFSSTERLLYKKCTFRMVPHHCHWHQCAAAMVMINSSRLYWLNIASLASVFQWIISCCSQWGNEFSSFLFCEINVLGLLILFISL